MGHRDLFIFSRTPVLRCVGVCVFSCSAVVAVLTYLFSRVSFFPSPPPHPQIPRRTGASTADDDCQLRSLVCGDVRFRIHVLVRFQPIGVAPPASVVLVVGQEKSRWPLLKKSAEHARTDTFRVHRLHPAMHEGGEALFFPFSVYVWWRWGQ